MLFLLLAAGLLIGSALGALLTARSPRASTAIGVGGAVLACVLGLIPAIQVLLGGQELTLRWAWDVPWGEFSLRVDSLSAFFLLPIFGLSALSAVYGSEYMFAHRRHKALGVSWFFYNLLVASMVLVVTARNGVLFLVAWEVMSLASFFLVTFEDEKESVRQAGWTYLVATHLGTAFLLMLFILIGHQSGSLMSPQSGSLDFDTFRAALKTAGGSITSVAFLLAVVGFGTKAGFMPFHVWLPEAHPAAPSHVSALMSGVMIKTGIYGILRTLTFLVQGPPPAWWGWLLVGIGLVSGILGVLFALAQHDIKRLLAYSSVENIGIIALGMGVGLLGLSSGTPVLAVLGFAGALLHVVNHAMFKGLLFLGAGAVLHATGSRQMDQFGGLLKRMRFTGTTFLIAAAAIAGLPPLNGFVSEFLIYFGAFTGVRSAGTQLAVASVTVIAGLALIGGLAAACFTKAFGITFLGQPRTEQATAVHEVGWAMRAPMLLLALGCLAVGLLAPTAVRVVGRVLPGLTGLSSETVHTGLLAAMGPLSYIVAGSAGLLGLVVILSALRRWLLAGREIGQAGTWDCGYIKPTARIQYTSSSFAQPLTDLFRLFLWTRKRFSPPQGLFPASAELATETPDVFSRVFYGPVFRIVAWLLSLLRWIQRGRVQLYVLYIAVTLLVLLFWKLGWGGNP